MNNTTTELQWGDVIFKPGQRVRTTDASDYAGLDGVILEIHTGEDKETDNLTPDIHCCFDFPESEADLRKLEERFSSLYNMPKKLDDLALDEVIMSPDELISIPEEPSRLLHYIGTDEWARPVYQDQYGKLWKDVELGDLVINKAAVRLDGTSQHYAPLNFPAVASFELTLALQQAAESLSIPYHTGISVSSDTFWPGQERYDSYTGYVRKSLQGSLQEWQALGALNYEMETAALFIVAQSFGLQAASICGVVAKRTDSELVAPQDLYELASQRFQAVVKKTLQDLIKAGK